MVTIEHSLKTPCWMPKPGKPLVIVDGWSPLVISGQNVLEAEKLTLSVSQRNTHFQCLENRAR